MSTCLGLYIEENIIKYAKVSKDRDNIKVESYGVKVYDNLDEVIKQIIEETYSYKTPISINLSEETYNFFEVFALLNKKDLPKAIKTEFEAYCSEKNYNPNVFETRYALTPNTEEKDKLRTIFIKENKLELNKKIQTFAAYNLQTMTSLPMVISTVMKTNDKENCLIVNIEEKTTITKILNQNIYDVKQLETGMTDIFSKINSKENSIRKAYEICKETTIYTSEGQELLSEESSHLEDIMPTLYDIVGQVRKTLNESMDRIDKIYISGTGALINNVDLYFEEYLENVKCEILKPSFIKILPDINIKDYIEVNSATALALSGLGEGITGMNFRRVPLSDRLKEFLTIETGSKKEKTPKTKNNKFNSAIVMDFNVPLDAVEKGLLRSAAGLLILIAVYGGFSSLIKKQIDNKNEEASQSINNTNAQMALIDKDIKELQSKTSKYTSKIANLEKISEKVQENNRVKKSIPILLNKLMYIIPNEVQITSIQNTTATHIEIQAQSRSYSQLGYLTTRLKTDNILTNVISTAGQQQNNIITIKIEGDLP